MLKQKTIKNDWKKFKDEVPKEIWKEIVHFRKTKIPRCMICKKNYIKDIEYTWKPNCEHNKSVRLSIG